MERIAFFLIQKVRESGQNHGSLLLWEIPKFTGKQMSLLLTKSSIARNCYRN